MSPNAVWTMLSLMGKPHCKAVSKTFKQKNTQPSALP